jgi:hypothetical protein
MQFHSKITLVILSAICIFLTYAPAQADDVRAGGMPPCMHAPTLNDADANKLIDIMRDNLKKMDAQLDKIRNSKDSAVRDKALQEYDLTLHENMRLSHGIGSNTMMPYGGMMEHGGMDHCMMGKSMMADPDERIEHLEKRMNNMQKMLDQMKKAKPISQKGKQSN